MRRIARLIPVLGSIGKVTIPYSVDFTALPDGALPKWFRGGNWVISGSKAVCSPTLTDVQTGGDLTTWSGGQPAGWTKSGTVTEASGKAQMNNGALTQTMSGLINLRYVHVQLDVSDYVSGAIAIKNTSSNQLAMPARDGTLTGTLFTNAAQKYVEFNAGGEAKFDNLRVANIDLSSAMTLIQGGSKNLTVKADATPMADATSWIGVVARADATLQNGLVFVQRAATTYGARLFKIVNGVWTSLLDTTGGSSGTVEIRCNGTSIICYTGIYKRYDSAVDEPTINNNTLYGLISFNAANYSNSFYLLDATPLVTVYMGGSNTTGSQSVKYWGNFLQWNYTSKVFTNTVYNAGFGGAGSWYGLIRYPADVTPYGHDVLFIEFAVNDAGDFTTKSDRDNEWKPSAEALIRKLRAAYPTKRLCFCNLIMENNHDARYAASRDIWAALCAKYDIPTLRIDEWLHGVIGTETPTDEQLEVYGDGVHFTEAGHQQIAAMWGNSLSLAYPPAQNWTPPITNYDPPMFDDLADFMYDPIIRNATDNDGETGTWSTVSATYRQSSEVGATITWTGTFSGCALNNLYGSGNGTISWSLDGGAQTGTMNFSALGGFNRIFCTTRGAHTVTITVTGGTVTLTRFLAI